MTSSALSRADSSQTGAPHLLDEPVSIVPPSTGPLLRDCHWRRRSWIYNSSADSNFGTLNSQIGRIETYLDNLSDSASMILSVSSIQTIPWIWAGLARGMSVIVGSFAADDDDRILHAERQHRAALRSRDKATDKGDRSPLFAPEHLGKGSIAFVDEDRNAIVIQGDAMVAAGLALAEHLGLEVGSVLHGSLPWQTVSGFVAGPMAALAAGSTWSPAPSIDGTDSAAYLGSLYRYRATHVVLDRETLIQVLKSDALYDDSFQTPDLQWAALLDDQPYNASDHQDFMRKFGVELAFLHGTDRFGGPCFGFAGADASDTMLGRPIGAELVLDGEAGRLALRGRRFRLKQFAQPSLDELTAFGRSEPFLDTGYRASLDGAGRVCLETAVTPDAEGQGASPGVAGDVYRLAAERFQVDASILSPQSNGENTPGWSSLTSVELVLAIEEHFKIAFSPREVMNMISLGDVIDVVQKHVAEA